MPQGSRVACDMNERYRGSEKVMKPLFFLLMLAFGLAVNAQTKSIKDIIGKWQAVSETDAGLEIADSTNMYIVYGDQRKIITNPSFDFNRSPIHFNFTVKDDKQSLPMKSLLLFVNDDLLQWQIFDGEIQPVAFSSNQGDLMYLRRKK
jgi:hypothetical protein